MALRPLALAAVLAALSLGLHAQTNPEDHAAHHPEGASAPASAAPALRTPPAATVPGAGPAGAMGMPGQPADMQKHVQAMREMHEKMAKARTPKEREALMAEHMKLMQEGMAMMDNMKSMGGMAPQGAATPASATPAARMQALEQRMDMMQSMMQMMMDRMPAPAAKP
ncbi:hypothetical protein [Azohydromonas lata]|uniref:Uncharacterized protein n=1 Tax=Azohydromonas lata TaxID=45677 RepID=A0ABU5I9V8_9BURK|nr:hypothetical protein [Azohydromonas lata]MDZ5455634.1 hypothetical protein [Azohydromonas lata]